MSRLERRSHIQVDGESVSSPFM